MLKIQQVLRNEKGENVLNDYFESIIIKGNFIIVKKNRVMGLYNAKTFSKILDCEWNKIRFDGDYILAYKNSEIAIFDVDGNRVLDFNSNKVVFYKKGILVSKEDVQGFFRYNGTAILNLEWKRIEPYSEVLLAYKGNGARRVTFDYDGKPEKN